MNFKSYCMLCKKNVHCCIFEKTGFSFISPKDAKDIRNKINKDYGYFVDYSPLSKKVIDVLKNCDPILEGKMRYLQLDKKNRILRLKTQNGGRCIFLGIDGKCKIYSIRPNICRIFPFWCIRLTNGKIKIIAHDIDPRCKAIKNYKDIDKSLSKSDLISIKRIFRKIKKESDCYKKQIKAFVKEL